MFENSLIESTHQKPKTKKVVSLPVSILIHGLVIGVALGASIWFVGDVPEPPIPVTFYAAAPRFSPPDGPRGRSKAPDIPAVHSRSRDEQPMACPKPSRPMSEPEPEADAGSRESRGRGEEGPAGGWRVAAAPARHGDERSGSVRRQGPVLATASSRLPEDAGRPDEGSSS